MFAYSCFNEMCVEKVEADLASLQATEPDLWCGNFLSFFENSSTIAT